MLELGKAGALGADKGVLPVLSEGAVVAGLRAASWRREAGATLEDRDLIFGRSGSRLVGRRADRSVGEARMWVEASMWRASWPGSLHGRRVRVDAVSQWRGIYRYEEIAGTPVGVSGASGRWRPRPTLTVHGSVPLDEQVFLLWVLMVAAWKFQRSGPAPWVAGALSTVVGGGS